MRKTIVMTIAVAITFTAGCSSSADGGSSPAEQAPQDAAYEDVVRELGLARTAADVRALVELAEGICASYDDGHTFIDVVQALASPGAYSYSEAGQINGAATGAYCPEHATA